MLSGFLSREVDAAIYLLVFKVLQGFWLCLLQLDNMAPSLEFHKTKAALLFNLRLWMGGKYISFGFS